MKSTTRGPVRAAAALACALSLLLLLTPPPPAPLRAAAHAARTRGTRTLRVMTYNIHVGVGMDKKLDLQRVAEVIRRERPDLVGLQEVDRGVARTGRVDQIRELARLTGMDYAFAHNLDYQGGQYGVAVLSRFPITAIDHRRFANRREAERRGFIRVEVSAGGQRINFVTTHLDYQFADGRLFETEQLLSALGGVPAPLVVTGDFNDEPTGASYRLMSEGFADAWGGAPPPAGAAAAAAGLTYPADKPTKRIDYVFYRKDSGIRARGARVVRTTASDHLPLVADLELAPR